MAVTRAKKTSQVQTLEKDLKSVSNMVVATYTKLTVAQDFELRKAVRGAGGKYRVVKNTLAARAAKCTKVEEALKNLSGVTSIAYTEGDPVALAKALAKYIKDTPELTFKAGVVEGKLITPKEIESLATMPSMEDRLVTSSARPTAPPPIAPAVAAASFSRISATMTRAPSAAKRSQMAAPMPRAPPVTMATLSLSFMGCGLIGY